MVEENLIRCQECNIHKGVHSYYKAIKEKLVGSSYEPCIICKDCIKKEYLSEYKKVNEDFKQVLLIMCEKYNVYFDESLMLSIKEENINDGWNLFQQYIKYISSLFQYQKLKWKDSIFLAKGITLNDINTENSITIKEKSDIEFINDDIKELKNKINKSLQNDDHNAHNKWMNSLRDAIELRNKLQGNKENIINIGTIVVQNDADVNKLTEELVELTKRNVKLR